MPQKDIICNECGAKVNSTDNFCSICGEYKIIQHKTIGDFKANMKKCKECGKFNRKTLPICRFCDVKF